jgi:hypothetical protein
MMQHDDLCMPLRWQYPLPCPSGSFLVANSFPSTDIGLPNRKPLLPCQPLPVLLCELLFTSWSMGTHTDRCTVVQLMDLMAKGGNKIEEGTSACLMKLHLQVIHNAESSPQSTPPRPAPTPRPHAPLHPTSHSDARPQPAPLLWTVPSIGPLDLISDTVELWLAGGQHRGCPRCVPADGLGIKDRGSKEEIHPTALAGTHATLPLRPCLLMQHHPPPKPTLSVHRRLTTFVVCGVDGE